MKQRTIEQLLLLTVMLTALGCANNEVMKKDEGLVQSAPQTTMETKKPAPVQPAQEPATSTTTDATAMQIAPADNNQIDASQQTALAGVVYFGFDSYVLTAESGNTLQANFNKLAAKPSIRIEGHCDEQGSSEYNLALGEKRAKVAQNYLVALGYPAAKITIISFGKEHPADTGHDEAAWAKNRRDELKIVK